MRRRVVRVPASSANLGPGFDVLACALGVHMELEVVETGRFAVVRQSRPLRPTPQGRDAVALRCYELEPSR